MERPSEQELASQAPRTPRWMDRFGRNPEDNRLGLKLESIVDNGRGGLLVQEIEKGSPAERAGLRQGDVLFQINGLDVTDFDELHAALANVQPGADHVILFQRDGKAQTAMLEQTTANR
jgi:S1-C subfamily serine protease